MRKIIAFYAWQSDTPEQFNRKFIQIALEDAAKRIREDSAIDVDLVVDYDRAGVPGTPPITDTILKKIDSCDIFIPDVTFVARTDGGKLLPNPNVMMEYGYALRAKTYTAMDGPARFRAAGEVLGIRDGAGFIDAGAGNSISLAPGVAVWLRAMPPFDPGKKWASFELRAALKQGINLPTLIGPANDTHTIRAEDGVGTCIVYSVEQTETDFVAFAFESGEVSAISTYPPTTHSEDILLMKLRHYLLVGYQAMPNS